MNHLLQSAIFRSPRRRRLASQCILQAVQFLEDFELTPKGFRTIFRKPEYVGYILSIIFGLNSGAQTVSDFNQNLSVFLEMNAGIHRGVDYLCNSQQDTGAWSNSPEITAKCLSAILSLNEVVPEKYEITIPRARRYLTRFIQSNILHHDSIVVNPGDLFSLSCALVSATSIAESDDSDLFPGTRRKIISSFQNLLINGPSKPSPSISGDRFDLYRFYQLLENVVQIDKGGSLNLPVRQASENMQSMFRQHLKKYLLRFQYNPIEPVAENSVAGCFSALPIESETSVGRVSRTGCDRWLSTLYTLSGISSLIYCKGRAGDITVQRGLECLKRGGFEIIDSGYTCEGYYTALYILLRTDGLLRRLSDGTVLVDAGRKLGVIERLLSRQLSEGNWAGVKGKLGEDDSNFSTALAILSMQMCAKQIR